MLTNGIHVDAPHFTGVLIVETAAHAYRFGHHEVAADQPDAGVMHGRVGQPHGEQAFQLQAQCADRRHDAIQRGAVGDAHVLLEGGLDTGFRQPGANLWAGAMDQYQLDAQAIEQCQIVNQGRQARAVQQLPGQHDHKSSAPVRIDIRGRIAEPVNLAVGSDAGHGVFP